MNIQGIGFSTDVPLPTVSDGDETPLDPRPPAGSELEEPAEREPDRIELSVRVLRKIFVGRFRQIVRSALERPEKLGDQANKKLRKEFHEALRALKRAGIHDQSEVNTLRKAFRDAQSSLEPARVQQGWPG